MFELGSYCALLTSLALASRTRLIDLGSKVIPLPLEVEDSTLGLARNTIIVKNNLIKQKENCKNYCIYVNILKYFR